MDFFLALKLGLSAYEKLSFFTFVLPHYMCFR